MPFLTTGGHTVVRIGRGAPQPSDTPQRRDVRWDPDAGVLDPAALEGVDAVVHLAGANVADRWTPAHRRAIEESRVRGTTLLATTLAKLARPPRVLVSASAIGYYGDRDDEILDESSGPGRGFLAGVAQRWEASTEAASRAGIRVVHARLGVVLSPRGGALPKLMLPFQVGAGGRIGDGRQWMSVIALDDVVGALHAAVTTDTLRGAVNVVGPVPLTNAELARTIGHVLHRPSFAAAPAFAVRLMLGREQADEMVLASQRVVPRALLRERLPVPASDRRGRTALRARPLTRAAACSQLCRMLAARFRSTSARVIARVDSSESVRACGSTRPGSALRPSCSRAASVT